MLVISWHVASEEDPGLRLYDANERLQLQSVFRKYLSNLGLIRIQLLKKRPRKCGRLEGDIELVFIQISGFGYVVDVGRA